jgi:hypothetical protein
MSYFTRLQKWGRDHRGQYAKPEDAAPPPHLRDKNKSTEKQGAKATSKQKDKDCPGNGAF